MRRRFAVLLALMLLAACAPPATSPAGSGRSAGGAPRNTTALVPLAVGNEWTYRGEYEGGDFTERVRIMGTERRGEQTWYRVASEFQGAEGTTSHVAWWRNDATGFHLLREGEEGGYTLHFPFADGVAPSGASGEWAEIVTLTTADEIAAALATPPPGDFDTAVCYAIQGQDGLGVGYCFTPGVGLIFETSGFPKVLVHYRVGD